MADHRPPFRIDTHVHTGRYSQCAEFVDPYQVEEWALRAGLDGVVIAEHDVLWEEEEIWLLRQSCSRIRFYRGIEVTAAECHLVVIGLDDAGPLHRGTSFDAVVEFARRNAAAVILAHPFREGRPERLPVELADAIEVDSTSFSGREAAASRRLARRFKKPMVAASDAHALSRIGWAWTELPVLPGDERQLAAAIRAGQGRPVLSHPRSP